MESLEESPVGGSPEVVSGMTTTNPMDNHGENGTFEELRDGSFRLMDKQGNEVTLSPEEMEKLVAQYEESKGYEGGPDTPDDLPVKEGRVTKSGLQNIIKEEYKKLLKESEPGDAGYDKYGRRIKSTFSGMPRNLPTDTGNVELDALGYQSMNFPGLNNELIQASEHIKQGGTLDNLPDELKKKRTHTFLFKTFLPYAQKMARNK